MAALHPEFEDAAAYLFEYVSTLDNLPSEIAHLLAELAVKEDKYFELHHKIHSRDGSLTKHIRTYGSLAANPQEESISKKIRSDFGKAKIIADEKIADAERAVKLIERYIKRLDEDAVKYGFDLSKPAVAAQMNGSALQRLGGTGSGTSTPGAGRKDGLLGDYARPRLDLSTGYGSMLETNTPASTTTSHRKKDRHGGGRQGATSGVKYLSAPGQKRKSHHKRSRTPSSSADSDGDDDADADSLSNQENADGSEALYCYCRQVSYGDMIACDNANCEVEWFHLSCVGLSASPEGHWYCTNCAAKFANVESESATSLKETTMKKRKR